MARRDATRFAVAPRAHARPSRRTRRHGTWREAIGLEFVRLGADVVLMARTEAKLRLAAEELEGAKVSDWQQVGFQVLDVTDQRSVNEGVAEAAARYGAPAFLVTCAGASRPGYFLEQDSEVFESSMRLNYMGTVHAIKAVASLMRENSGGHIMIVASALAVVSFVGFSSYAPTKEFLVYPWIYTILLYYTVLYCTTLL